MRWLSRDALPADELQRILAPHSPKEMEAYPVSERVNKPDADDKKLIERVKGLILELGSVASAVGDQYFTSLKLSINCKHNRTSAFKSTDNCLPKKADKDTVIKTDINCGTLQ
jgi:hypothetical protein